MVKETILCTSHVLGSLCKFHQAASPITATNITFLIISDPGIMSVITQKNSHCAEISLICNYSDFKYSLIIRLSLPTVSLKNVCMVSLKPI